MTKRQWRTVAATVLTLGLIMVVTAIVLFYVAILFGDETAGGTGGLTLAVGGVAAAVGGVWLAEIWDVED